MNYDYVKAKGELVLSEIIDVSNSQHLIHIVGARDGTPQTSTNAEIVKFKMWQLQVLGYIASTKPAMLKAHYDQEYGKLCVLCKKTFLDGDAGCNAEFQRFVMCRMIHQAGGHE